MSYPVSERAWYKQRMQSSSLADLEVQDETGTAIKLGALWADKKAVVAFVRHFG